ncbi:PadR family transcriptional regulator [candidate division KSB1 bacterium]
MKLLTRPEELVLLAVWRLQNDAYCVPIREQLMQVTAREWSFGAIYDPLDRLEKKGLLESFQSEPTRNRGGRSKRIYELTKNGLEALIEIRSVEEAMWKGISKPSLKNQL